MYGTLSAGGKQHRRKQHSDRGWTQAVPYSRKRIAAAMLDNDHPSRSRPINRTNSQTGRPEGKKSSPKTKPHTDETELTASTTATHTDEEINFDGLDPDEIRNCINQKIKEQDDNLNKNELRNLKDCLIKGLNLDSGTEPTWKDIQHAIERRSKDEDNHQLQTLALIVVHAKAVELIAHQKKTDAQSKSIFLTENLGFAMNIDANNNKKDDDPLSCVQYLRKICGEADETAQARSRAPVECIPDTSRSDSAQPQRASSNPRKGSHLASDLSSRTVRSTSQSSDSLFDMDLSLKREDSAQLDDANSTTSASESTRRTRGSSSHFWDMYRSSHREASTHLDDAYSTTSASERTRRTSYSSRGSSRDLYDTEPQSVLERAEIDPSIDAIMATFESSEVPKALTADLLGEDAVVDQDENLGLSDKLSKEAIDQIFKDYDAFNQELNDLQQKVVKLLKSDDQSEDVYSKIEMLVELAENIAEFEKIKTDLELKFNDMAYAAAASEEQRQAAKVMKFESAQEILTKLKSVLAMKVEDELVTVVTNEMNACVVALRDHLQDYSKLNSTELEDAKEIEKNICEELRQWAQEVSDQFKHLGIDIKADKITDANQKMEANFEKFDQHIHRKKIEEKSTELKSEIESFEYTSAEDCRRLAHEVNNHLKNDLSDKSRKYFTTMSRHLNEAASRLEAKKAGGEQYKDWKESKRDVASLREQFQQSNQDTLRGELPEDCQGWSQELTRLLDQNQTVDLSRWIYFLKNSEHGYACLDMVHNMCLSLEKEIQKTRNHEQQAALTFELYKLLAIKKNLECSTKTLKADFQKRKLFKKLFPPDSEDKTASFDQLSHFFRGPKNAQYRLGQLANLYQKFGMIPYARQVHYPGTLTESSKTGLGMLMAPAGSGKSKTWEAYAFLNGLLDEGKSIVFSTVPMSVDGEQVSMQPTKENLQKVFEEHFLDRILNPDAGRDQTITFDEYRLVYAMTATDKQYLIAQLINTLEVKANSMGTLGLLNVPDIRQKLDACNDNWVDFFAEATQIVQENGKAISPQNQPPFSDSYVSFMSATIPSPSERLCLQCDIPPELQHHAPSIEKTFNALPHQNTSEKIDSLSSLFSKLQRSAGTTNVATSTYIARVGAFLQNLEQTHTFLDKACHTASSSNFPNDIRDISRNDGTKRTILHVNAKEEDTVFYSGNHEPQEIPVVHVDVLDPEYSYRFLPTGKDPTVKDNWIPFETKDEMVEHLNENNIETLRIDYLDSESSVGTDLEEFTSCISADRNFDIVLGRSSKYCPEGGVQWLGRLRNWIIEGVVQDFNVYLTDEHGVFLQQAACERFYEDSMHKFVDIDVSA